MHNPLLSRRDVAFIATFVLVAVGAISYGVMNLEKPTVSGIQVRLPEACGSAQVPCPRTVRMAEAQS